MKAEIRKLLGTDKIVLGTDKVLKSVRAGDVSKVILASNAPAALRKELERYKPIGGFELVDAGITNDELGTTCKKPFSVAAIAFR